MKDDTIQTAVNELRQLVSRMNEINQFLHSEGVHYNIKDSGTPKVIEIVHLVQQVKYDL